MTYYFYKGERHTLSEILKRAKREGKTLEQMDISYDNGGEPIEVFKKAPGQMKEGFNKAIEERDAVLAKQTEALSEKDAEIAKLKALLEGSKGGNNEEEISKTELNKMNKAELVELATSKGLEVEGLNANQIKDLLLSDDDDLS